MEEDQSRDGRLVVCTAYADLSVINIGTESKVIIIAEGGIK